jgi:hypothetical protein
MRHFNATQDEHGLRDQWCLHGCIVRQRRWCVRPRSSSWSPVTPPHENCSVRKYIFFKILTLSSSHTLLLYCVSAVLFTPVNQYAKKTPVNQWLYWLKEWGWTPLFMYREGVRRHPLAGGTRPYRRDTPVQERLPLHINDYVNYIISLMITTNS